MAAPRVLVVGAGLIGTSIGLAAGARGARVSLVDADPSRVALAVTMGAGASWQESEPVELVVVAAPPDIVGSLCVDLLRGQENAIVTHTCSVQVPSLVEVETQVADASRFVGSHPIAGREVSGPAAASGELFVDRPWAICPGPQTSADAVAGVDTLARLCGAHPVVLPPHDHDRLLATLSHAPQIVASALAATVAEVPADAVGLSGSGMRDTTRLADSDPQLWGQIAAANAAAVAEALRAVAAPLLEVAAALETGRPDAARATVEELLRRGRSGRAPVALATVHCAVPDSPGALARLLAEIAADEVNVEDLRVEHAPGQPVGVAELAVQPADRDRLLSTLRAHGWAATAGADESL